MKLTWHHIENAALFVDETGKITAKVEEKSESIFTVLVLDVSHGEYITEDQAKKYVENYLEVK